MSMSFNAHPSFEYLPSSWKLQDSYYPMSSDKFEIQMGYLTPFDVDVECPKRPKNSLNIHNVLV